MCIRDSHNIVIFYCRADVPQTLNKLPAMLRLNVMEALVADEVFDLIQPIQRGCLLYTSHTRIHIYLYLPLKLQLII